MNFTRLIAGAAALGLSLAVQAQLKPSGPGTPPLPPPGVTNLDAVAAKEVAAVEAAERWLAMLDKEQYGKAWDECATLFRQRVTREQWVKSLPKTRGVAGKVKARRSELSSYKTSLPGAPDGEYVSVRFSTSFEKKDDAKELMTMVFEKGAWRPVGYGIQ
jgi:hypothetical protein